MWWTLKPDDGGAEVSFWRIPEVVDQRMSCEQPSDGSALHTLTTPVDQTNKRAALFGGGLQIIIDNQEDVARMEGVEIDRILDGDAHDRIIVHIPQSLWL